ncbi:MAG: hypothetical protein ACOY4T_03920 [Pseudomonadota bacterium]
MTNGEIILAKRHLRQHLSRSMHLFHGRPTERLAAMIAAELIGKDRQTPLMLVTLLQQLDELRGRLSSAKV